VGHGGRRFGRTLGRLRGWEDPWGLGRWGIPSCGGGTGVGYPPNGGGPPGEGVTLPRRWAQGGTLGDWGTGRLLLNVVVSEAIAELVQDRSARAAQAAIRPGYSRKTLSSASPA
jgi:hypothetical protein